VYGQKEELIFLGREISEQRDYSESVAQRIDAEVRRLVQDSYDRARSTLRQYRAQLDLIARRLIEVETIDRDEFERLFSEPVKPKNGGTPLLVPVAVA
ncbi:MAG: ATP-dependent zinc metalloprotease FtsH, partial [Anaerolineales bacterium]